MKWFEFCFKVFNKWRGSFHSFHLGKLNTAVREEKKVFERAFTVSRYFLYDLISVLLCYLLNIFRINCIKT